MDIYFTADTHFYHKNVIKFCERPVSTVEEMNELLITRWNEKVKGGVVFHLGDFSFSLRRIPDLVNKLNGTIRLVAGNHDKMKFSHRTCFDWVRDYYRLKNGKQKIVLSHYPFARWDCAMHGAWHLHGHCHGTYKPDWGKILDVGVDNRDDYSPWHYDEIVEYMSTRG